MKQHPHGSLGGQATQEKPASGGGLLEELLDRYGGGANRLLRLRHLDFTRPQVIFWAIFALMASSLLISVWTRRNDQTVNRSFGASGVSSTPPTINSFQSAAEIPHPGSAPFSTGPSTPQYPAQAGSVYHPDTQSFPAPRYEAPGSVEHQDDHSFPTTGGPALPTYAPPMYSGPAAQSYVVPTQESNGQRVKTVVTR